MATFRRRPSDVVEAEQFLLGQPLPAGVEHVLQTSRGAVYGPRGPEDPVPSGLVAGFAVWTRHGWALIYSGSWVVTTRWGQRDVHGHDAFHRQYDFAVPEAPGN